MKLLIYVTLISIIQACKFGSKPNSPACCTKFSLRDIGCVECDYDTGICIDCHKAFMLDQTHKYQRCLIKLPNSICHCKKSFQCVLLHNKPKCYMKI